MLTTLFFLFLISFLLAAGVTAWLSGPHTPLRILDHPNERSLHESPVHRTGGLGVLGGALGGWLLAVWLGLAPPPVPVLAGGILVLLMVAFVDDLRGVPSGVRFLVQLAVALMTVSGMMETGWVLSSLLAVALVWMINLYNFMDGMDGFAGGMAAWGFGLLAIVAGVKGFEIQALYCALLAGGALGFLRFNFPPARIFMGDMGSTLLGYFAGVTIIEFHDRGILSAGLSLLVFSPFIVDATVTLLRRLLRGERFWQAHRSHYYQRLVQAGWGHRKTVLAEYALMLLTGISALAAAGKPSLETAIPALWLVLYGLLMWGLEKGPLRAQRAR